MPLVQTRGAVSAQGFGEFAQAAATAANYIEEVFSTYLYTGTGASQTITNNIDLSTKGGLVWLKGRSGATDHKLTDTARGVTKAIVSNSTAAQTTDTTGLTAFGTTGFTIGADANYNTSAATYASWTWRKQAKYFDIQTYTGNGSSQNIAHNLGSVPGCIIVKRTDGFGNWGVYHIGSTASNVLLLNNTIGQSIDNAWNNTTPTSTVFSVGTSNYSNANGGPYVAYLFAHDAGGFGLTGTDNVISCGSAAATGVTAVNLGYEPQFCMIKRSSGTGGWLITDTMRGWNMQGDFDVRANVSDAEADRTGSGWFPSATGFTFDSAQLNGSGDYIYIAIRRGPMKVPTVGTSVYNGVTRTGTGAAASITTVGFSPDLVIGQGRSASGHTFEDKLRGYTQNLESVNTSAESTSATGEDVTGWLNNGITVGIASNSNINASGVSTIGWYFQRAPSVFDVVCYTGTGANTTQSHNLGAVPEMIIVKSRSASTEAEIYVAALGNDSAINLFGASGGAFTTGGIAWNYTTPTASVFSLGTWNKVNGSGVTFVAWIFATCAGVSKVGSYTGNGTTQTINCGFTGGARFVLIKRTDTSGGWYTYDTTRGMTVLTDPYLLLNSSAAEVATLGSVTTVSTGFALNSTILAAINVSAGSYIFLAIA